MVSSIVKLLFGCFLESHLFGLYPKISKDDMDGLGAPHGGPYKVLAGHNGAPPWSPLLSLGFTLVPLWKDSIHVIFGFL